MTDTGANGFFALNSDITYQAPERITDGEVNFVSFKPQSIGAYGPGQSVEFKLRSTNEFVILDRSYMKFSLVETGSVTASTAGTSLVSMGGLLLSLKFKILFLGFKCHF